MIGPDLRSSAFQVLSALAVPENRSARGNMDPVAKAFHNQRPQAIAATGSSGSYCLHAATGFPQPAATGHCSHRLSTTMRPQVISDTGFPCGHMPCTGVDYAVQRSIVICCYCNNVIRLRPVHRHQHQHQHQHQHPHHHHRGRRRHRHRHHHQHHHP